MAVKHLDWTRCYRRFVAGVGDPMGLAVTVGVFALVDQPPQARSVIQNELPCPAGDLYGEPSVFTEQACGGDDFMPWSLSCSARLLPIAAMNEMQCRPVRLQGGDRGFAVGYSAITVNEAAAVAAHQTADRLLIRPRRITDTVRSASLLLRHHHFADDELYGSGDGNGQHRADDAQ